MKKTLRINVYFMEISTVMVEQSVIYGSLRQEFCYIIVCIELILICEGDKGPKNKFLLMVRKIYDVTNHVINVG